MAQKWYQKATVQGALVTGVFLLAVAVVSGIFDVIQNTSPVTETNSNLGQTMEDSSMSNVNSLDKLPAIGTQVGLSSHTDPPTLVGLKLDKRNPFHIDFILSKGDAALEGQELANEALKLVKYFLTALTLPEDQLWVNLSPYEKDRIITDDFASTRMGREFLQQDYLLKQLTASLTYPENELGSVYWATVYKKAGEKFGTIDQEFETFNKVWIVPDHASVVLLGDNALITSSRLAVLTDYDYLASKSYRSLQREQDPDLKPDTDNMTDEIAKISSDVTKAVLIPELEKEVNFGENFGPVRQAFNALVLATWYKQKVRDSLLNQAVANKLKLTGLTEPKSDFVESMYARYIEAFNEGVFNYIREEYEPSTQEIIPRKYFSGGITAQGIRKTLTQPIKKLTLRSLQAAVILVHATLFASSGELLAQPQGPGSGREKPAVLESVVEDVGGIDFGREFRIEEIGEGIFEFDPNAFENVGKPNVFSPEILRLMAFSSLGTLIKTNSH